MSTSWRPPPSRDGGSRKRPEGARGGDLPPHPFAPFLENQGFVVLDGGLATALEDRGYDLRDPLWSARVLLDDPGAVRSMHLEYLAAGADCITTATYQATVAGLGARGLDGAGAEAVLRRGVALAAEARELFWAEAPNRAGRLRPLVAAGIGPYGAYLANGAEYTGEYDLDEEGLVAWHRRRWHVLAAAGADLLACETIPSLAEVRALVRLAAESPDRWFWMSFQCRDGALLADGTPVGEAARACEAAANAAAVGVNCVPPVHVAALLERLSLESSKPLLAYPNSGESYDAGARRWVGRDGEEGGSGTSYSPPHGSTVQTPPAAHALRWRALGAVAVGGCCRTGPEDIRAVRRALTRSS